MTEAPSPFETAAGELRRLGITLTRLPGEYRVNFHNAAEAAERVAETLDEALEIGRSMAAERPPPATNSGQAPRRRPPRRMTPKAIRRRMIRAHNHRMRARARALKKQPEQQPDR